MERRDFEEAAALAAAGRSDEALASYRRLIEISPDVAEAHNNLGTLLASLGREREAIPHFERAIALQPQVASTYGNLGVALYVLGRSTDARTQFRRQAELEPRNAHALGLLGVVLVELGELDEARERFECALELEPRNTWLLRRWAEATTVHAHDPALAKMELLVADTRLLSRGDRVQLHFALGKAYDDIGRYADAFDHLNAANRLKRQDVAYDEVETLDAIEAIRSAFTADAMRAKAGTGDPSRLPIFIVGMPRSGTTLVEQILSAHPRVFAAGEIGNFERVLAETGPHEVSRLGRAYVESVTALAPLADRVTDKMLQNFRHVGLIHLALPNARIVHVVRDPVDTCLSCFSQLFMDAQPYSYDLGELGRYYRAYSSLMRHWRTVLPSEVMLDVNYEDLVGDLEREARRVTTHCGLEWDPACLQFHAASRPVRTASAAQVRRPLYATSIGKGNRYRAQLLDLLRALDPLGRPRDNTQRHQAP